MGVVRQTDGPLIERRRLPRLTFRSALSFRNVLKPHETFTGSLCRDISAGGIRMIVPSFVPKDARLVLLFSLPGRMEPIRTIGRVVWMQEKAISENCECGVQFVEILPEDQETIAGYVERGVTEAA